MKTNKLISPSQSSEREGVQPFLNHLQRRGLFFRTSRKEFIFAVYTMLFTSLLFLGEGLGLRCSAQNIGISATGATPDNSAMLDVVSPFNGTVGSDKGLLIPRVALTSSIDAATIATPATSLLVYNLGTGGLTPAGYYYNQGGTGINPSPAPNWVPFLTNNANAPSAWSLTGNAGTTPSSAPIGSTVNNNFIGTTDNKDFVFATNSLERMRITTTGTLDFSNVNDYLPQVRVEAVRASNNNGGYFILKRANGTPSAKTTVSNGDQLGAFLWQGYDGTSYVNSAHIRSLVEGTVSTGKVGANIGFLTMDANGSTLEHMRITSTGNVGIGTTNPTSILHTIASGAKTAAYTGNLLTNTATSSTASVAKIGLDVQSTGTWNGTSAVNTGLNVNVSGGTTNYAAIFSGGNVGIGTVSPAVKTEISSPGTTLVTGLRINTVGTPTSGAGAALELGSSANSISSFAVGKISSYMFDGTAGTQKGHLLFSTMRSGTMTEAMRILNTGYVGIGCTDPQYKLHVVGDIAASGVLWASSATVSTGVSACSDIRFKKDFTPLNNPLQHVLQMQGFNYYWKKDEFPDRFFNNEKQIGFKAQDLQKLLPEVVVTDKDGYLSVDYSKLTPILVEAIKEQQKIIDSMQLVNNNQQKAIDNMQLTNDKMKAENELRMQNTELEIAKLKATMEKLMQTPNPLEVQR